MNQNIMEQIAAAGIIPVVVLDDPKDAVATAKALRAGGVDVMEITFRTSAAAEAVRMAADNCPGMIIGAGTVITLEQCKQAVACGAQFIVSPGLDREVVSWCLENGIAVVPGCTTPSEIMAAMRLGFRVVKFFPAGIYGGLSALKALSGPFPGIKFIPTGGVNGENIGEYIRSPFIHAVGGSWVCPKKDIAEGNFFHITALCVEAKRNILGFEVAHIGINCANLESAREVCGQLSQAFGMPVQEGGSSSFVTSAVEVTHTVYPGTNGHIAIQTNAMICVLAELAKRGLQADLSTAKYKGDRLTTVYLKQEFGGFAVHLLQR